MTLFLYITLAVLTSVALALLLVAGGRALLGFLRFRGTRIITCPETRQPAAVKVDLGHVAETASLGTPHLRLSDCSRWPEREDCGQECLGQIEVAPHDCLVRIILVRWYEGKKCVLCGTPLSEIHWHDRKPALLTPDDKTVDWSEIPPEKIPQALKTHRPVCWDCHVAETLRRMYPDLVIEREQRWFDHTNEKERERRPPWRVN